MVFIELEDIGGFVILGAVIAFGIWLYLYVNFYSDWFKKGHVKKEKQIKKIKRICSTFFVRLNHLEANLNNYTSNQVISELEYIVKLFFIYAYNLTAKGNQSLRDILIQIRKKEGNEQLYLEAKNYFRKINERKFGDKQLSQDEATNLLEACKIIFNRTIESLNI